MTADLPESDENRKFDLMSKTALKKELQTMTQEQLVQTIIDAYSARPEIKEYFEFFLNPDAEALFEKSRLTVARELDRVKRGYYSKARISVLRKQIKLFDSFQPGAEWSVRFRLFIVSYAVVSETGVTFPPALMQGIADIMCRALDLADATEHTAMAMEAVERIIADETTGSRYFRRLLADTLADYLAGRPATLRRR